MDQSGNTGEAIQARLRAGALRTLGQHVRHSGTGCCGKCGRSTGRSGQCDAPEVLEALRILYPNRPEYLLSEDEVSPSRWAHA